MPHIRIVPLPAFSDNYIWVLHDTQSAVVVDPGDARVVETFIEQMHLQLSGILVTHHHADHTGGIPALCRRFSVPVYGPAHETIAGVTHPLQGGDKIHLASLGLTLTVLDVPGHTAGHIAFYGDDRVFCGDTLFSAGCGRIFEGTPEQMYASLALLAALPDTTRVYCTHEYTLSNLAFACAAEPDNPLRDQYLTECQALRAQNRPTLPSTLGRERSINPFLRTLEPGVMAAVAQQTGVTPADPVACLAALREWKNRFPG